MKSYDVQVYSVTQVNALIKTALETSVGLIAVQGEVTGFRVTKERLVYFELKDKESRVLCFMMIWDLKQPLADGMEVKAYGMPSLFVKSGGLHFRVHEVELVGEGALKRAFEALRKKLDAEGLFALERKRAIPIFPERIGLITSSDGAAYTDIVRVLGNRWGGLKIYLYPCGVQGYGAAESVVKGFEYFNKLEPVDVIILARGGGSLEDLQSFNAEIVARAIFGSRAPVISGVGHERDATIADFVADVRASTPSNAAERAVPDREEIIYRISAMASMLLSGITEQHRVYHRGIENALNAFLRPIRDVSHALKRLVQSLTTITTQTLISAKKSLSEMDRLLASLNPRAIMKRGYSIVRLDGEIIHRSKDLAVGSEVEVELYQGHFKGSVKEIV